MPRFKAIPFVITAASALIGAAVLGQVVGAFEIGGQDDYPDTDVVRNNEYPTVAAVPPSGPTCELIPEGCALAQQVVADVRSGNIEAVLARRAPLSVECLATPERQPLCANLDPGVQVEGFNSVSFAKAALLVSDKDFRVAVESAVGDGDAELISVACEQRDRDVAPDCSGDFVVGLRLETGVVVLMYHPDGDVLTLFGLYVGGPLESEPSIVNGGYMGLAGIFPRGNVGQGFHFEQASD